MYRSYETDANPNYIGISILFADPNTKFHQNIFGTLGQGVRGGAVG